MNRQKAHTYKRRTQARKKEAARRSMCLFTKTSCSCARAHVRVGVSLPHSVSLSLGLSIFLSFYFSVLLSLCLSVCLAVSRCLAVSLSHCLTVSLSRRLSVFVAQIALSPSPLLSRFLTLSLPHSRAPSSFARSLSMPGHTLLYSSSSLSSSVFMVLAFSFCSCSCTLCVYVSKWIPHATQIHEEIQTNSDQAAVFRLDPVDCGTRAHRIR